MRLLATDLDGTLLQPDGTVSHRNAEALQAARAAGWFVVIATGRPPFMVTELATSLGDSVTHGVMANGSVVATLPDLTVIRSVQFDIEVAVAVVRRLRAIDPGFGFALATNAGFAHEPGFAERLPAPQQVPASPDALVSAKGATEAIKLMVFHHAHRAHELLTVLPPLLAPLPAPLLAPLLGEGLSVTHMGADCVEVGPAGIDKGTGLRHLCEVLGVAAADVVAFGDEFNDHEMLRWAGLGVAMANANETTRSIADEVTAANIDDGVALVIERLLRTG